MSIVENFYAAISERPRPHAGVAAPDNKDDVIALRQLAAGSSFPWAMQLLPVHRREAMYALYAFCVKSTTSQTAMHRSL